MASTTVVEKVLAEVIEVTKNGKEGKYTQKAVKVNDKTWSVSKNDSDEVKVGQKYNFKLSKSEYNDKLYYWANLIKDESPKSTDSSQPVSDDDFKKQAFAWLDKLDKDQKKKVINYLLEKL